MLSYDIYFYHGQRGDLGGLPWNCYRPSSTLSFGVDSAPTWTLSCYSTHEQSFLRASQSIGSSTTTLYKLQTLNVGFSPHLYRIHMELAYVPKCAQLTRTRQISGNPFDRIRRSKLAKRRKYDRRMRRALGRSLKVSPGFVQTKRRWALRNVHNMI